MVFNISDECNQVLLGSMCGDGHIEKIRNKCRFEENHSVKQSDYLLWKSKKISELNPKMYKASSAGHNFLCLKTPLLYELNTYKSLFYPSSGRKIISKKSLYSLDELGLAVWYLDDGTYNLSHRCCSISSCMKNFTVQCLSKEYFSSVWGLDTTIPKNIKGDINSYILRFSPKSTDEFLNIIKPYVPKCMNYKMGHLENENIKRIIVAENKRREYSRKYNMRLK